MIVGADIDGGDEIAFLWTPHDGIRALADVLPQDDGFAPGDFVLRRATGISDDGLTDLGHRPLARGQQRLGVASHRPQLRSAIG